MKNFLISISPDYYYFNSNNKQQQQQECLQEGSLQSLSDNTEPLSYDCHRYLISRSEVGENVQQIPFVWKTPKCGCFTIK